MGLKKHFSGITPLITQLIVSLYPFRSLIRPAVLFQRRARMAEVTFVIKAMATLVSSLKKTSNSPSNTCKGKTVPVQRYGFAISRKSEDCSQKQTDHS